MAQKPHAGKKELGEARKKLQKAKPGDISSTELIGYINVILEPHASEDALDLLALLTVLLKQLKIVCETSSNGTTAFADSSLLDTLHRSLLPAFQPNGPLANLILINLESSNKPSQLRAGEALHAAGKLSLSLPPPTVTSSTYTPQNYLLPLFNSITKGSIVLRPTLAALSILVEYIPVEHIPDSLDRRLLDGLELGDSANLRCSLIARILDLRWVALCGTLVESGSASTGIADQGEQRNRRSIGTELGGDLTTKQDQEQDEIRTSSKRSSGTRTQHDYDRILLYPLLPYFDASTNPPSVWTHMIRYLLPACAKINPDIYQNLLRILNTSTQSKSSASTPVLSLRLVTADKASTGDTPLNLDPSSAFTCWISVASLAVSSRHVSFREIPTSKIKDGLSHADAEVRLKSFQLVTTSEDLLDPICVDLIREGLKWNTILPGAGQRSEFASALHAFLTYLQVESHAASRAKDRLATGFPAFKEKEMPKLVKGKYVSRGSLINDPSSALKTAHELHAWIIDDFITPGLAGSRRYPVVRVLLALAILRIYLGIFAGDQGVQEKVFSRERVEMLLACQASEYAEVRSRARSLLDSAKIPLPGYETLSTPASQALFVSAMSSLNHPRKTQAEAGRASLCILVEKLVKAQETSQDQSLPLQFVEGVMAKLEDHLISVERDLGGEIERKPLHGLLAALRDLVDCLDLTMPTAQIAWSATFHHLYNMISRIWTVTRTVISLAPAPAPASAQSSTSNNERPDHEIARAYEVITGMDGDGEGEDDEDGMDHTGLLSGCWRATKEAGHKSARIALIISELLAAIFASVLKQGGATNTIWTKEDVDSAGQCFLTWMHEIRHRGTFSKVAAAFGRLVEAVKSAGEYRDLCDAWLSHELQAISSDQHSTTRRSAALPYSVLSLVSSDITLLDRAISVLLSLADIGNKQSSDVTKVHAFNVLKIVLLDFRQTKLLDRYFERSVLGALQAFESANWNVRNVGLILFSTLVHRSLSNGKSNQNLYASRTALSTRQTFSSWHNKYPSLIPYIVDYLRKHQSNSRRDNHDQSDSDRKSKSTTSVTTNQHSPLFPLLIILRSLRYSPTSTESDASQLRGELVPLVEDFLGSKEWQIRQVSAQALSSLISPEEALDWLKGERAFSTREAERGSKEESGGERYDDFNLEHGRLLLAERLMADVLDWTQINSDESCRIAIEGKLKFWIEKYGNGGVSLLGQKVFDCLNVYLDSISAKSSICEMALEKAIRSIRPNAGNIAGSSVRPGWNLFIQSATAFVLRYSDKALSDATSGQLLAAEQDSDIKLLVLEHLESSSRSKSKHDSPTPTLSASDPSLRTFQAVITLALSPDEDQYVRIAALNALTTVSWPRSILKGSRELGEQDKALRHSMESIIKGRGSVPLREAALVALGWNIGLGLRSDQTEMDQEVVRRLAAHLLEASHEDQPSRQSALQSLSHIAPHLFHITPTGKQVTRAPTQDKSEPSTLSLSLHTTLLRLLQDDDEDIRIGAAKIVKEGLGCVCEVSQDRAVELWWDWVGVYLGGVVEGTAQQGVKSELDLESESKPESELKDWLRFLVGLTIDADGLEKDLTSIKSSAKALGQNHARPALLFEVEPPNLFRDPLVDARNAAMCLSTVVLSLKGVDDKNSAGTARPYLVDLKDKMQIAKRECEAAMRSCEDSSSVEGGLITGISPVDDAWESMRVLKLRREIIAQSSLVL